MKHRAYKGKRKKPWYLALLVLLLMGCLTFGGLFASVILGAYHHTPEGEVDVMVILGCEVKPWGPSILLQDRLDTALDYLQKHPDQMVIVSGGQGPTEPTSEARAMADYLMAHGVPEEQILLEDQSSNTKENFLFSFSIWQEYNPENDKPSVLVVSNGFHLTRARILAERAGFGPVYTLAAPSSDVLVRLRMYVREPLALAKSLIFDW